MVLKRIKVLILGAACFFISQWLLRLPLLNYLKGNLSFTLFTYSFPLLYGILLAFSAGLFEEGFRFLFKRQLLRPEHCTLSEPLLFGFGHGLCEALLLLVPLFLSQPPLSMLFWPVIERILAIILHMGLTVIVWNGFQKGQRLLYLLLAIALHTFVNSSIPIVAMLGLSFLYIELLLLLVDLALIYCIIKSKKYYLQNEIIGGNE